VLRAAGRRPGWARYYQAVRVIAGDYRSRPLSAPRGLSTRPTSDRLRETLFNVLAPRIQGARFADLYAGSGAVGIEALSRGAASVTFVENGAAALAALRGNLSSLGIRDGTAIDSRPVSVVLHSRSGDLPLWDIVFLDPPYHATSAYAQTLALLGDRASALLAPDALVIAEHRRKPAPALAPGYGALQRTRVLEQGDAALSFYAHRPAPTPPPHGRHLR
jgi:16S rRNA (guanine966-N2)-methyltransferase